MTQPEVMTAEERLNFAQLIELVRFRRQNEVPALSYEAKEADQALLLAADHMAAQERRNDSLSIQNANLDKKLSDVMRFMRSLEQAIRVARSGIRVGEVEALESTLSDLQTALGLKEGPELKEKER